jgi:asparagine synthase (glutamine-hydrolysing)
MCGIAGTAALNPRAPLDAAQVRRMLDRVAHRGPDDDGLHAAAGAVLGHRRLSVIDVAGGHQPLFGARPTTAIVANGEIYNYLSLRRELEARGHRFRTNSDTEVAAHAYDAWGDAFLDRVDGMFALALWDGARRRLLLARDRMGEKPLYWTVAGGALIYASELSAVLAHSAVAPTVDPYALSAYLANEYVPAPHSMIRSVSKLEPGTALILEDGRIDVRPYWKLRPRVSPHVSDYGEAVSLVRAALERAVRSRLISDVPVGIFLSGGLDSSAVAALAARDGTLDTFSIGFDESSFDESGYARVVAEHIGSRHHQRVVRAAEMPDLVPRLGSLLDEPMGDASILPTWLLSAFAREHVTVALGGDGGDELFGGYYMHQAHRFDGAMRRVPRPVHRLMAAAAARLPVSHRNFSPGFKALRFLRGSADPAPYNHALWMASFSPAEQAQLLEPDVLSAIGGRGAFAAFERAWAESEGAPLLARACWLDARTYLPNDVLTKVDRASMAVALEVRAPLLARDVVELAFALPDAYRMRRFTGKRIFRDAVRDLLPDAVLRRPKKGFGMPVAAWLRGALRPLLHDTLSADRLRAGGLFRPDTVARMLREHDACAADHRKPLWTLLVFELWRAQRLSAAAPAPTFRAVAG